MPYVRPKGYYNERSRKYRDVKRRKLDALKAETGCLRCPEADPACLDFHHRDPATKTMTVSRLYAGTWGWDRIMQEIALCDVLCASRRAGYVSARAREARAVRSAQDRGAARVVRGHARGLGVRARDSRRTRRARRARARDLGEESAGCSMTKNG